MERPNFQIFAGYLADEKCILFGSIVEKEILKSLRRCQKLSQDGNQTYRDNVQGMFQRLGRWGLREDQKLTESLKKTSPGCDMYMKYTLLSFAKKISSDPDTVSDVQCTMPTVGAFLHRVMAEVSGRPEVESEQFLIDSVQRKLTIHDTIRCSMLDYVQQQEQIPRPAMSYVSAAVEDEIQPDDSISQVYARTAKAEQAEHPHDEERSVAHDSQFKQKVAEKIAAFNPNTNGTTNTQESNLTESIHY
jgi:hypothetical protein